MIILHDSLLLILWITLSTLSGRFKQNPTSQCAHKSLLSSRSRSEIEIRVNENKVQFDKN